MKQKLYALDAFFIEKLKLSENYPYNYLHENEICSVKEDFTFL